MITVVLVLIYVSLFLYQLYKYATYRPPNFPPGPPRIPVYGAYLLLLFLNHRDIHLAVLKLCKWYKSSIVGFYIGTTPTVVANDFGSVKELLNRVEFDGRPGIYMAQMRDPEMELRGIFFTDRLFWRDQRRFTLRHLRDYGFGRRFESLESDIRSEMMSFIEMVRGGPKHEHERPYFKDGGLVNCPKAMFACFGNAFLQVLVGERFPRTEQAQLFQAGEDGMLFQRVGDDYGKLLSVTPWIRHIFPKASGYADLDKANKGVHAFMRSVIDKQIKTFDANHERHFVDLYIQQMKQAEAEGEKDTAFYYNQLIMTCLDFFFPALTALGTQFTFMMQIFIKQPEVLQKIQAEIDNVVGQGRLPELDDRLYLPYTEACVRESMRHETLVPSSIPHKSLVTAEFRGYTIPPNCFVVPGLYAFHNEKDLWGDPENFRPERFLDMKGNLSLKKDVSLPFGAGKRLCAGETFARNALFLFTGAMCQNFNFSLTNGDRIDDIISKNFTGIVRSPIDFWIKFEPR